MAGAANEGLSMAIADNATMDTPTMDTSTQDRPTHHQLTEVVQQLHPDATLIRTWVLRGGISAQMTALEVMRGDGTRHKLIVRQPNARTLQLNPRAAADEFRLLQIVQAVGVKTQTPYLLDESGTILPAPYLVIEYIEGAPEYAPADPIAFAEQVATQLATLHSAGSEEVDLAFLPAQAPRLNAKISSRPATLDESLQEGDIRAALETLWPIPAMGAPTLLHGDFWPGNLLWQDGKLVAVIDWEDAEVGDPIADLATTRLDMLWIVGHDAMHALTARYQALRGGDYATLPAWDLVAALRPMGRLDVWAADWPALGRSDITEATMAAQHQEFVAQAVAQLGGQP
jgi:aminoglycoside phosphotransferase (APT) family kinase protein